MDLFVSEFGSGKKGHTLLIRGASSAFGRAAVNLVVEAGAVVTGTTRSMGKKEELKGLGVKEVVLEGKVLPERMGKGVKFDRVLEVVGNIDDGEEGWEGVPGGVAWGVGSDQGLQPAVADGERGALELLWELCVWNAGVSAVGCSVEEDCECCCGWEV